VSLPEYSNDLYVVLGSYNNNRVQIYKNPIASFQGDNSKLLAPVQVLQINKPNYIKFSASSQLVMVQNGNQFACYDAENDKS
jgi:hypothetical protein